MTDVVYIYAASVIGLYYTMMSVDYLLMFFAPDPDDEEGGE